MKKPETYLRLGLGLMYLYSGYSLFTTPTSWTQFIPFWLKSFLGPGKNVILFARVQGIAELLFAVILLMWFLPARWVRWLAFVSAVEMLLILYWTGVDLITFRDIGLLGAALALGLSYHHA